MASTALRSGILGFLGIYVMAYLFIGIPLLYMEMIVGQFTARDCIKVWRIRQCFSHIGYVLVIWQIFFLIQNHQMVSFINYYMLLSFEKPIPFYQCGKSSDISCDILNTNYTVNHNCLKSPEKSGFCNRIQSTFPEYQFWRFKLLDINSGTQWHIEYRVCISSFIVCALLYICCFKRRNSFKVFVNFFTVYPTIGYVMLLIGSMTQEGSVKQYNEIMDTSFKTFLSTNRISLAILHVIQTLGLGTGVIFNWSSSVSFRSPCYSYTVISVIIGILYTILSLCTTAMVICPFAYQTNFPPNLFMHSSMSLLFEKIPIVLKSYVYEYIWLFIYFSSNFIAGFRNSVVIYYSLMELIYLRYQKLEKYSELVCLIGVTLLFATTIPLFGTFGIPLLGGMHKRFASLACVGVCTLECVAFLFSYGLERLAEDVHFMLGIKPKWCIKFMWLCSIIITLYVFILELFYHRIKNVNWYVVDNFGILILAAMMSATVGLLLVRLLVAWLRGRLKDVWRLDRNWGPDSEVLQRSRAMFSAQAMTKEYMYRQYQLRAGILERQKKANIMIKRTNL